jgi:ADP-ribose pyrophosphatase
MLMKLTAKHRERFRKTARYIKGNAVGFRIDEILLPDNRRRTREYLTHPGAVGVLAFESPSKILLVKQFRYPMGVFTYEIPAGKLDKGEDPGKCVRRELEEETGFVASKIRRLVSFWPTAAFSQEVIHLYVAEGLKPTRMNPDDDEYLELLRISPRKMEQWIRAGKIRDSKTLIAYLAWKAGLSSTKQ